MILGLWFAVPYVLYAQDPLVTCDGPNCNFCSLVTTVDNVIDFLIILAVILSTIMLAIGGFKLVASKGNPGAMKDAKQYLINVCIGILIVMAAWTIVDTLMKLLVNDTVSATYGPWHDIKGSMCGTMFAPGEAITDAIQIGTHTNAVVFDESGVEAGTVVTLYQSGGTSHVSGTVSASACDTSQLTRTSFLGHSIQIHRSLVPSLQRIDSAWRSRGGTSAYRVYSLGGYSCRTVAGSNKQSYHSFGLAIDVNAATNPHLQSTCRTDMPSWFRDLFLKEGWGWGCNWRSSKDAMHFSKASSEGGNMSF